MFFFFLVSVSYAQIFTYSVLEKNCFVKIDDNTIDSFKFFEVDFEICTFEEIKKRYRKLALKCHPDRLYSTNNTSNVTYHVLSDNMIVINKHFENLKIHFKTETPIIETSPPPKKRYSDFSLNKRVLFKTKLYVNFIIGLLTIWFFIKYKKFRIFFICCLFIVIVYSAGLFLTFLLFLPILIYFFGIYKVFFIVLLIPIFDKRYFIILVIILVIILLKIMCYCCCCKKK